MSLSSNFNDVIETHPSIGTETKEISSIGMGWTPFGDRIRFGNSPKPIGRKMNLRRGKLMGTDFEEMVSVEPPKVHQYHSEIDAIKNLYKFREPDKVEPFLSKNKTLIRIVSSIYTKIRKEFPSEDITLEAVSDSPLSNEKDIVISVSTSLPVDEAIERLDKVEDISWDKDSRDPYVDICVKLEYQ